MNFSGDGSEEVRGLKKKVQQQGGYDMSSSELNTDPRGLCSHCRFSTRSSPR
jgi:hypothetical protein